ncbi:MAG: hypothetical protein WAQ05_23765, partial [Rubrivivax sp.]
MTPPGATCGRLPPGGGTPAARQSRLRGACWAAAVLGPLVCAPAAWANDDIAAERERITTERRAIEAAFADEAAACRQRFVVTPCVDAVRRRQREALEPLRQQELLLVQDERQRRAAQRAGAVETRQAEIAARGPASPAAVAAPRA